MGLGKTIQVLYFIEWYSQKQSEKPILIVAPVSLLENWQNEYKKFFPNPNLTTVTIWGNQISEHIFTGDKEATIANLSKKSIYLTTYETLRRQQIPLAMIDWGVVVLDEAQKIKTPGTFVTNAAKALKSDFKVAMTGTPVENSLMDLWCIIDFCSPGLLENAKSFSNKYQKPLKDKNVDFEELSTRLRDEIGSTLLRRMKIDVAKDLPTIDYFKYEEVMPPKQFDAYVNEVNQIKENSKIQSAVLQGILNLRSLSDHPYLKHYQLEEIPTNELIEASAKLKKAIDILKDIKNKNEKAIVFTENKSMQRVLRKVFREIFHINPAIINGETPSGLNTKTKLSRQQEIDKFQAKEGFNVIIMSPIAAGFGLNITEANHIIHYTRHWNPAKEQQATDRAYRIGQKKPVQVYYPMAIAQDKDIKTFDLVLDDLLSRKSHLAKSTLFPTDQIEISKDEFAKSIGINIPEGKDITINSISSLDILQPIVFESAIAVLMEKVNGGKSFLTNKSNEKVVDIVNFNENGNLLIQVKQSYDEQGINSGQEVKYALSRYKDQYQYNFNLQVITNNYFTQSAIEMANINGVELIDRRIIASWIEMHSLTMNEIDRKMEERI
jgi:ERCC4-related helicase